jgi:uridine kinase
MTLRSSRVSVEKAVARVARGVRPPLIAIDGLPCSGKGTLVTKLKERVDLDCIYVDDFVLPEEHWRSRDQPAFPFQFIRYDAFLNAVKTLAATGRCSYYPFDWNTLSISDHRRTVRLTKPIVIEGVSSLNPALCDLCGLKIFVESDRKTSLQTALCRGVGAWEREWRELFLPSADIYMQTRPERRPDFLVPGRGILGRTGE